ncbi:CoA-binding protein [archaeon]|nr:CoA-binding protein [archaeon]
MNEKEILEKCKTIAVVGCSTDPKKPANYVPGYLKEQGYRIIPVNPFADEILGEKVYKSLEEVPDKIDTVLVFRPGEETPDVVKKAVEVGAKAVWLQEGIKNDEAEHLAEEAGLGFVMDRCMLKVHKGE